MIVPPAPDRRNFLDKIRGWSGRHPYLTLTLVVVAALGPFLAKPFNLDDPLFLWVAKQIQAHPGDPFGFEVNWYGTESPMWVATDNPPLTSYYIALAAAVLGWSEPALHCAFLLPALAVVCGTYRLARRYCDWPALAAVATLIAPAFWVSGTTVMCDVMMLGFWVWAVVFWVEGLDCRDYGKLTAAGLLMGLAVLTKFSGVCLLPLLAAYGLMHQRRVRPWAACLLIPLAAIGAYQWITRALYGRALFTDAMGFVGYAHGISGTTRMITGLTALTFTGGCLAGAVFLMPWLWGRRALVIFGAGTAVITGAVFLAGGMLRTDVPFTAGARIFAEAQTVFWTLGGLSVLALAGADFLKRRDAAAALLALWVFGTFFFTAFCNWTVNARSILPMAPAVGILLARRLGGTTRAANHSRSCGVVVSLAFSAALAGCVTESDFQLAIAVRQSARDTMARFGHHRAILWYQGHWGFQYYMDLLGAKALDMKSPQLQGGDFLALPLHNCCIFVPKPELVSSCELITVPGSQVLSTWSPDVGAGFYSSSPGPMPFAFGHVLPEYVNVYCAAVKK
jgi:4-amino-4-deoxy-L-arabinose transferase-like glycosyltransferase